MWLMGEYLLVFLLALLGGVIGSLAHKWGLERKTSQLEIELYDLKERLLIEMKKRASHQARKAQEFDQSVLEAAKQEKAPAQPTFWWQTLPGYKPQG